MAKSTPAQAQTAEVHALHPPTREAAVPAVSDGPAVRAVYRESADRPAFAVEHREDGTYIVPASIVDGALGIPADGDTAIPLATWLADAAPGATLYRRPELVASRGSGEASRYVYLVGTESTADRLRVEGAVATTCAGGLAAWRDEYAKQLQGRHVVLVVTQRSQAVERVVDSLAAQAGSVAVLTMEVSGEEFFASGRTLADLDQLVLRADRVVDPQDWPTPASLAHAPVPAFPTKVLPGYMADVVDAISESMQVPADFAAMHALGTLATAAAGLVEIELPTGYRMPVCLWTLVLSEPGTRKSAAHAAATKPLTELSDVLADLTADQRREAKADRVLAEAALKEAEAQLRSAVMDEEKTAAKINYAEALRTLEEAVVPARPKLAAADATPEAVARNIWAQGGRYAISSSEPNVLQHLSGLYGKAPNIDVYLQAYSGDPFSVDRGGFSQADEPEDGPAKAVRRPALTINVSAQPSMLSSIDRSDAIVGRGAMDRFCMVMPDDIVGTREVWPQSGVDRPMRVWCDQVVALGTALWEAIEERLPTGEPADRPVLQLSADGAAAMKAWLEDKERRLSPKGDLRPIRGWVSKVDGTVARIAALLHLASNATRPLASRKVSLEHVQAALAIGDYLIPHAKRAWRADGDGALIDDCREIVEWLRRQEKRKFDRRELYSNVRRFKDRGADSTDAPLTRLVEMGYLRELEVEGARTNRTFVVNPIVHGADEPDPQNT